MGVFDVRGEKNEEVDTIIFAERNDRDGDEQAYRLSKSTFDGFVLIEDSGSDSVVLSSKEHAQNLIKAVEKAIDLGWLQ